MNLSLVKLWFRAAVLKSVVFGPLGGSLRLLVVLDVKLLCIIILHKLFAFFIVLILSLMVAITACVLAQIKTVAQNYPSCILL